MIMFACPWWLRRDVRLSLGNKRRGRPMDRSAADFHRRQAAQTLRGSHILFVFCVAEIPVLYGGAARTCGRQDGLRNTGKRILLLHVTHSLYKHKRLGIFLSHHDTRINLV